MNIDDKTLVLIACRCGDEPLSPGAKVGYQCESCGKRLQVTPQGLERKAKYKHARLLCNLCALKYAELAKTMHKFDGVEIGTAAAEYMKTQRSERNPLAQWVREQKQREPK
jgi:hypothetical protein